MHSFIFLAQYWVGSSCYSTEQKNVIIPTLRSPVVTLEKVKALVLQSCLTLFDSMD